MVRPVHGKYTIGQEVIVPKGLRGTCHRGHASETEGTETAVVVEMEFLGGGHVNTTGALGVMLRCPRCRSSVTFPLGAWAWQR